MRTDLLNFRVSPAERRLVARAARLANEKLSAFLRRAALTRATAHTLEVGRPVEGDAKAAR